MPGEKVHHVKRHVRGVHILERGMPEVVEPGIDGKAVVEVAALVRCPLGFGGPRMSISMLGGCGGSQPPIGAPGTMLCVMT